jgi:hypothetical protein
MHGELQSILVSNLGKTLITGLQLSRGYQNI